jgi:agmatine deiminase
MRRARSRAPGQDERSTTVPLAGVEQTPADLGFRMPAEWEPHEATWLAWPHARADWPGKLAPIPWVYGEVVRNLVAGERVRILVRDAALEASARRLLTRVGVDLGQVDFFRVPTDRSWTRDTCPLFVRKEDARHPEVAITDWKFNGWAKYPNHRRDDAIPERLARALEMRRFVPLVSADGAPMGDGKKRSGHAPRPRHVVLEGGSVDVNGAGALLTTEECLLSPVQARNPGVSRAELEAVLASHLGIRKVLWLGRGIAGDDTHGHVDDLARFVSRTTVVLAEESNPDDENQAWLAENRERLEGMSNADGERLEIVSLPMPAPLRLDGVRLPASYANFYIGNTAVLVPTFNDPADRVALGILAELFPDRRVVGIHAVDLVWGLGTLHCMTQQQPGAAAPPQGAADGPLRDPHGVA